MFIRLNLQIQIYSFEKTNISKGAHVFTLYILNYKFTFTNIRMLSINKNLTFQNYKICER